MGRLCWRLRARSISASRSRWIAPLSAFLVINPGRARRSAALAPLQISAGGMLAVGEHLTGDDRLRMLDRARPGLALYIGGMGARGKNFYNDLACAYGYEQEAAIVQDLYLSGKKTEAAAALELVHTYSLIHDDLPSMDDARTRRGQPCTHLVFGESTAVLAAMDLIAIAYRLVADNADRRGRPAAPVIAQLSNAIGHDGIVRGQHADLAVRRKRATLDQLTEIYTHKAAALFLAAVRIPASILDIDSNKLQALEAYALNLGLAFQITDDLLDAGHAPEDAGRTTFSTHLGIAGAEMRVRALVANATAALSVFGDEAVALKALAEYVGIRKQ